jgi:hypothetical protein
MQIYDLCLAWNWEHDADFANLLEAACQDRGLSFYQVTPQNIDHTVFCMASGQMNFRILFDRASDSDIRFMPLVHWAVTQGIQSINPFLLARQAWDKAIMNDSFCQAGLCTPKTLIIPSFLDEPDLEQVDVSELGQSFVIKPAHGGGGIGVLTQATTWEEVATARQEYPQDKYLLQTFIAPVQLGARPAWFRVIYFSGQVFPCWWEPVNHIYAFVDEIEETQLSLQPLRSISAMIAEICNLELFSTEIALTPQGSFTVIDHVNDPIDLRLQTRCPDGIPDWIVRAIAEGMADLVRDRVMCQV